MSVTYRPRVSIVLPTYNEAENIKNVVRNLDTLLKNSAYLYELILVDDDSPDGTWKIAQKLASEDFPNLRVIRRLGERGLATAVLHGWSVAKGDFLAVIDADGQHPPQTLLELIDCLAQGADIAVASRHAEGGGVSDWSFLRRFLSRGAQIIALFLVPSVARQVSDPMSGFFALRRAVIQGRELDPIGYKILLEVLGRGNYTNIREVSYVFLERVGGKSKVTRTQYWEYLQHLVRLGQQTGEIYRFLKFGLVGVSGVLVNLIALWLLKEKAAWPLWESGIGAVEISIISNFLLNDNWTFRAEAQRSPGIVAWLTRLLRFNLICAVGAILNVVCMLLLTQLLGMYYLISQLVAVGISMFWNYTLNAIWNWQTKTNINQPSLARRAWTGVRAALNSNN
ncbi:MAG: glycosyltransferase family 2 protein [Gloeobacterales cyanobacterium]